jgi:pimeloyl-ACP methyl ester carboxylesterase
MAEITQRTIETNHINMHIAEAGSGPLVILCHGFPESWYSWRHQLQALAETGFHAVAPDMRGYGRTDAPEPIDSYTLLHLVGDIVGLAGALGADRFAVAGHDWGAPVAWHCALLRPDIVRGVIGLSVPFVPRGKTRPTSVMPQDEHGLFYQLYFQTPGVAEEELGRDPRATIRRLLYSSSGDGRGQADPAGRDFMGMVSRQHGFLARMEEPEMLPAWLSGADIEFYGAEFARAGFRGGLNWYRNIDRNWELLAAYTGARVAVPALYIAGDRDAVLRFKSMDRLIPNLKAFVPQLRDTVILPGCGHWTQQERAAEVNDAMIRFLKALP